MSPACFGHGLPFSRAQLESQLRDSLFTPVEWDEALYFPPFDRRVLLRIAPAIERFGTKVSIGVAGVVIVEARKELVAPVSGHAARRRDVSVLKPVESGPGSQSRFGEKV